MLAGMTLWPGAVMRGPVPDVQQFTAVIAATGINEVVRGQVRSKQGILTPHGDIFMIRSAGRPIDALKDGAQLLVIDLGHAVIEWTGRQLAGCLLGPDAIPQSDEIVPGSRC